ncbi:MAG: T9SS type A sorting domain-containing protein [Bacteroidota bacterium]
MNRLYTLFIACFLWQGAIGQTVVTVAPGNGTLNDAIQGYIDTNGSVDGNVIFELEDGGIYILTSSIDFDFDLNIQAEEDAMTRPVIQPTIGTGGETFRPFRVRENITLRGLYITSQDALGGRTDQIIRISKDGARVIIDNCHLDKATQAAFRIDNANNRIYVTNSIVSNIINEQNPSNGRAFDDRGQDIDTLWVENSTFYNFTARLLRDDGGVINWLRWNQTTCVNSGDRTLDMGQTRRAIVTNNLFINPAFMGDDEPGSTAFQIDSLDEETQEITISHNNFYNDPALQTLYNQINETAEEGDSVFAREFINGPAQSFIDTGGFAATIYNESVAFVNAPATPIDYISSFYTDPGNTQPLDLGNGGALPDQVQLPFDFSYNLDSPVATGGTEGQPLGDARWMSPAPIPTIVRVDPGNGTLNDSIQNYIDANGSVDGNVLFELEDGGIYILTSTIDFDFDLNIQAEEGAMTRPVIQPTIGTGGETFRPFRVRENITLRGLYITSQDALGGRTDQIIRISKDGARVIIDNCHLDKATQAAFRIDNANNRIYVTNTIVSNIINEQNPSNGRAFDDRGQDIDTLWVENSTFYNFTARLLRDDGGVINWLRWNQTTCVNSGDRTLDMGQTRQAIVTNNLFINPAFMGDDEPGSTAFQIDSLNGETQNITISHNNFYNDPALLALYNQLNDGAAEGDSVFVREFINGPAQSFIDAGGFASTIYNEPVTFVNAPATPIDYISSFYTDPGNTQPLDLGNGGSLPDQVQLPFNFDYEDSSPLAVGGTEGQRLGDLNWQLIVTSVDYLPPNTFDLVTFPNPTYGQFVLSFDLPSATSGSVEIYDLRGRQLWYHNEAFQQGKNQVELDISKLPKGTYLAKLNIGGSFTTTRILKL